MDYKKVDRIADRIKNPTKKKSEDRMIKVVDKKDNLEKFVKKSEVMKDPSKYFPTRSSYEAALQIAKTKEPGSRLSVPDIERAMQSIKRKRKGGMSKIDKLRSTKGQFTIEGRLQTLKDKLKKSFGKKLGGSISKTDKKKFNPRTGEETNKPRGKDPRTIYKPENIKPKPITKKTGGLTGGQKNLDKNKNNRIDAQDFKILKAEKAKGRGMGLQDESIKPGKVQKAFLGKMIKGAGKSIGRLFGKKKSATATPGSVAMSKSGKGMGGKLPQLLQKAIDDGIIKPASKGRMMKASKGGGADAGRAGSIKGINAVLKDKAERRFNVPDKTDIKKQKASVTKLKQQARRSRLEKMKERQTGRPVYERMGGGMMKKYSKGGGADTGKMGELRSKISVAMDRAKKGMGSRPKLKAPERGPMKPMKKMGGGMMQRPMGYSKGTMVMARGCKLGRKKPTKIM